MQRLPPGCEFRRLFCRDRVSTARGNGGVHKTASREWPSGDDGRGSLLFERGNGCPVFYQDENELNYGRPSISPATAVPWSPYDICSPNYFHAPVDKGFHQDICCRHGLLALVKMWFQRIAATMGWPASVSINFLSDPATSYRRCPRRLSRGRRRPRLRQAPNSYKFSAIL